MGGDEARQRCGEGRWVNAGDGDEHNISLSSSSSSSSSSLRVAEAAASEEEEEEEEEDDDDDDGDDDDEAYFCQNTEIVFPFPFRSFKQWGFRV
jgi:TATA-binding protein-associated factor Taf7